MAVGYDPDVPFNYVLEEDRSRPTESQTVFFLKSLTARDTEAIENAWRLAADDKRELIHSINRGTMVLETLRRGLRGWSNFRDAAGKEIRFRELVGGLCPLENIDRLTPEQRHELARTIENGAKLSEGDRKN